MKIIILLIVLVIFVMAYMFYDFINYCEQMRIEQENEDDDIEEGF